jgi:beta-lactamase superfamily II metal-dependent hydrolase
MSDYFEIDFLDVETAKSGDAIAIRYEIGGETFIHVVDGGYIATGDSLVTHIRKHYGSPTFIDNVVVTHQDGDHTAGLRQVLEEFHVGTLWMLRPWLYASEIVDRVKRFTSVENLAARLRSDFPNLAALEEIANDRGITIREPFQGQPIGAFTVLAPSRTRYLNLILQAERTPDAVDEAPTASFGALAEAVRTSFAKAINFVRAAWGVEVFSTQETSVENEMSVVQAATLNGERILLTGDVGRGGLAEAADYAPAIGWVLPGVNRFQVPHHGGRRNVSTELLDRWLGPKLANPSEVTGFTAIISAAKADEHHPRKAVVRAMLHRGGRPYSTENGTVCSFSGAPSRGWGPSTPLPYPEDQEE